MVVQKTLNNLKDKSHEEKQAVASGIAIGVIVILLIGWGILFIKNVQNMPTPSLENGVVPTDQFNLDLIRGSQGSDGYDPSDDLRNLRESAVQAETEANTSYTVPTSASGGEGDQFDTAAF